MNCILLPYTTRKLERNTWNPCFQALNNRQCRTDAWEEGNQWGEPGIMLAFCLGAHARPRSRKRDAKENKASSPSWGVWDQNSENVRCLGAVVAQTFKEGVAMQNESPENLPKGPTLSLLTPNRMCTQTFHVGCRGMGELWAEQFSEFAQSWRSSALLKWE